MERSRHPHFSEGPLVVSFTARSNAAPPGAGLRIEIAGDRHVSTVSIAGDVDLATVPLLDAAAASCLEGSPLRVIVDLSRVTFFGATGLTTLLRLREQTGQAAIDLVLRAPSPIVRTVLDVVGAGRCFQIEPAGFPGADRGHALASNAAA